MVFIIEATCLGVAGHHQQASDINYKHKLLKPLRKKLNLFHLKTQSAPRNSQSHSVIKINHFMLFRQLVVYCSDIHMKHINTLCGQSVKKFNVKLGDTLSDLQDLKG